MFLGTIEVWDSELPQPSRNVFFALLFSSFTHLRGPHSNLHSSVLPQAHWPLTFLCCCTPLLLNTPLTLPLKHSILNNENCFICAHVCKWKLLVARGPGFCATPQATHSRNSFAIELGKGIQIQILLSISCWRQSFIFWASCSLFRGEGNMDKINLDPDKAQSPPGSEPYVYFTTIRSVQAPSQTG